MHLQQRLFGLSPGLPVAFAEHLVKLLRRREHGPMRMQPLIDSLDPLMNEILPGLVFELEERASHIEQNRSNHRVLRPMILLHFLGGSDTKEIQPAAQNDLYTRHQLQSRFTERGLIG